MVARNSKLLQLAACTVAFAIVLQGCGHNAQGTDSPESKDSKNSDDSDQKVGNDGTDNIDSEDSKDSNDSEDSKDSDDKKESKKSEVSKDNEDKKHGNGSKDSKDSKGSKESKLFLMPRDEPTHNDGPDFVFNHYVGGSLLLVALMVMAAVVWRFRVSAVGHATVTDEDLQPTAVE
jgi:hypothetical protein